LGFIWCSNWEIRPLQVGIEFLPSLKFFIGCIFLLILLLPKCLRFMTNIFMCYIIYWRTHDKNLVFWFITVYELKIMKVCSRTWNFWKTVYRRTKIDLVYEFLFSAGMEFRPDFFWSLCQTHQVLTIKIIEFGWCFFNKVVPDRSILWIKNRFQLKIYYFLLWNEFGASFHL
jgi:hypothetical protein